jgi:nucleoside-diphosphate-sugar epimerase
MIPTILKENLSKKKIIVTGANGYVGSTICNYLSQVDCHLHRLSTSNNFEKNSNTVAKIIDHTIDWNDDEKIENIFKEANIIIHLAAQTSAYKSEQAPLDDFKANVENLAKILATCHKYKNYPVVLLASTVTVYGMTDANKKINEETVPNPTTIYDVHKLAAESLIRHYSLRGSIKGATLRLANVYGPGKTSSVRDRGILNQIIKKSLNNEPATIFGDGKYLRDYVYINDVALAFLHVATEAPLMGEAYNIASGESQFLIDAVKTISNLSPLKINFTPEPENLLPIEKRNFRADISLIKKNTRWCPATPFATGVMQSIEALKKGNL